MNIQHFDNLDLDTHIRVIELNDQPWFAAKDVCDSLGHSNSRKAISKLDDDEKTLVSNSNVTDGSLSLPNRGLQFISESGLYTLIFTSQLPSAQKFRKWVTSEVLPAIRKHGRYDPAELAATMPPRVRQAYLCAQMEELERQIAMLRTQADMAGIIPGQYTVFQWLLLQGDEPKGCGTLSGQCKRLCDARGIVTGFAKVIDHCGQSVRLSRTAHTYPEEILAEVCGKAS